MTGTSPGRGLSLHAAEPGTTPTDANDCRSQSRHASHEVILAHRRQRATASQEGAPQAVQQDGGARRDLRGAGGAVRPGRPLARPERGYGGRRATTPASVPGGAGTHHDSADVHENCNDAGDVDVGGICGDCRAARRADNHRTRERPGRSRGPELHGDRRARFACDSYGRISPYADRAPTAGAGASGHRADDRLPAVQLGPDDHPTGDRGATARTPACVQRATPDEPTARVATPDRPAHHVAPDHHRPQNLVRPTGEPEARHRSRDQAGRTGVQGRSCDP